MDLVIIMIYLLAICLPAMIRKFHEAKISGSDTVILWGDGSPFREFLFNEDLADALVFLWNILMHQI